MIDPKREDKTGPGGPGGSQGRNAPDKPGTPQRGGQTPPASIPREEPRRGGGRIGEVQDSNQAGIPRAAVKKSGVRETSGGVRNRSGVRLQALWERVQRRRFFSRTRPGGRGAKGSRGAGCRYPWPNPRTPIRHASSWGRAFSWADPTLGWQKLTSRTDCSTGRYVRVPASASDGTLHCTAFQARLSTTGRSSFRRSILRGRRKENPSRMRTAPDKHAKLLDMAITTPLSTALGKPKRAGGSCGPLVPRTAPPTGLGQRRGQRPGAAAAGLGL